MQLFEGLHDPFWVSFSIKAASVLAHRGGFLFEFMRDTALLHDGICRIARFYLSIHSEMPLCDWAIPDIMIAFSVPDKGAAMRTEHFAHFLFIPCHYIATCSRRSDVKSICRGERYAPFNSSSSGTA